MAEPPPQPEQSHAVNTTGSIPVSPPRPPPNNRPSFASFMKAQSRGASPERPSSSMITAQDGSGNPASPQAQPPFQLIGKKPGTISTINISSGHESWHASIQSPDPLPSPDSANPLYTGAPRDSLAGEPLGSTCEEPSPGVGTFEAFQRDLIDDLGYDRSGKSDYQAYLEKSDRARLTAPSITSAKSAKSTKSAYDNDFRPAQECPTYRDFYQSRFTFLNITVIIICIFSCVFAGIFLVLAIKAPRYGRQITSSGSFTPSSAILLTTIMAKLVEISFVTSFVAFLGQVLSRRAFMKDHGRGVTLSELGMWRWVVQPGTIVTHWETARYAGSSLLGLLSLLSAALATSYSSAATALVQPMLINGTWDHKIMAGNVRTDFMNVNYIANHCQTPIRDDQDAGNTCLQLEHAGQGYFNYHRYLAFWDTVAKTGNGTTDQRKRQPGFGQLNEKITSHAQWVNIDSTRESSKRWGRAINNVSLAMPHTGIVAAALDKRNDILQPEELNSEGTYALHASLPSPVINVLCANMLKEELKPLIFDEWNTEVVNITTWPSLSAFATTTNKTVVDELFRWNDKTVASYPPVFPRYPSPANTIMNHTSLWGRSAIYLLGQGEMQDNDPDATADFVLCKIHAEVTPECSTRYTVTGSGSLLEAHCEDPDDKMAYIKSDPGAPWIDAVVNWKDIGYDWANALSLNTGISDGDSANAHLLMELMLKPTNPDPKNMEVDLNPVLPSIGEALAVMSGCTLLKGMLDAPLNMFWNHSTPILDKPEVQFFKSVLMSQQYASGGIGQASKAWLVVLALVFVLNIFVLLYFLLHRGLVTDYSEPQNLFSLAVNSPPSHALAGSCGGGPEGKQYMVNWFVKSEGEHLFMEPDEKSSLLGRLTGTKLKEVRPGVLSKVKGALGMGDKAPRKMASASGSGRERLRASGLRTMSVVGEYELEDGQSIISRRVDQFSKRKSRL